MLVLSRKTGEQICIGNSVFVSVQRVSGNRVVLGIDAPPEVSVVRTELREKIQHSDGAGKRALTLSQPSAV